MIQTHINQKNPHCIRKYQQSLTNPLKQDKHSQQIKIHQEKIVFQNRIGFKHIICKLGNQKLVTFEAAYVQKLQHFAVHAVNAIPILHYINKKPEIILIANYRPPIMKFCLEFPGGYVQGEDYQQQAKRQCLQQIGYQISSFQDFPKPVMFSDPWRSNQSIHMFVGKIDGDDSSKFKGQNLQQDQNIRIHLLPLNKDLLKNINQLAKQHDYAIEKNVWATALGIVMKDLLNQQ